MTVLSGTEQRNQIDWLHISLTCTRVVMLAWNEECVLSHCYYRDESEILG